MKKIILLSFLLSQFSLVVFGQVTLTVTGEKYVYPAWYYYTISCSGHQADVIVEVLISSHGSFSDVSNVQSKKVTIKKDQSSVSVPIRWNHTSVTSANVEAKAIGVAQKEVAKLNITTKVYSSLTINAPEAVLAAELFNIKLQSTTPYKNYSCSGNGLSISSGQGTKDVWARFYDVNGLEIKTINAHADMDGQLGSRKYANKSIEVLPNRIQGSIFVCYNEIGSYSYNNMPSGASNIRWAFQNGKLNIISGQGTKSIQARANPKSIGLETVVLTFNYRNRSFTVKFNTTVGRPIVESVYGPGIFGDAIETFPGVSISLYASPNYPNGEVEYVWDCGASSRDAIVSANRNSCSVTYLSEGYYQISCYTKYAGCPNPAPWSDRVTKEVYVGQSYYSISPQGNSGVVDINKNMESKNLKLKSQSLSYELRSLPDGTLKSSGNISAEGGTLDFSNLPRGLYILNVVIDANNRTISKIIID